MSLTDDLIKDGWLKTPDIIKAFRNIKREDFLPEGMKGLAEANEALPIGWGQTISQPLTVAFMLELLQPEAGNKILDVGSGSGWGTALLCDIVGRKGKIAAMEIIPQLAEFGKKNAEKYSFVKNKRAEFIFGSGSKGFEKYAPYDRILVSAAVENSLAAETWKKQLKIGGRLVCPIQNSIWLFVKKSKDEFSEKEYQGFVFVPLV